VSRTFFTDVAEALPGFLPRPLRSPTIRAGAGGLKVWYGSWHEHFECQRISRAVLRAAGVDATTALEVGFHAEHPRVEDNEVVVALIGAEEKAWRRALGREPELGPFVGRREQRDRWRRLTELWTDGDLDGEAAAFEAAERLGGYIRAIAPVLARTPSSRCACWRQSGNDGSPG
jgi:hypothetical protein